MSDAVRYLGTAELKSEGQGGPFDPDRYAFMWEDLTLKEVEKHGDVWDARTVVTLGRRTGEKVHPYSEAANTSWCMWTEKRVYFPVVYDGNYSVGSVPRNPTSEGVGPFGGGG